MILSKPSARLLASATLALGCAVAQAAPVTLNLQGSITGYDALPLESLGLTIGLGVNLSVTFNETFSDGDYNWGDPLGPVSGSMSVGGFDYSFGGADPAGYGYNGNTGQVYWVRLQFLGSGPTLGGGEFEGLFARFTPDLQLEGPLSLSYAFTTVYDDFIVTSFGYALITPDSYSITPADVGAVPVPPTLPLVATALLGAGWVRRRSDAKGARSA